MKSWVIIVCGIAIFSSSPTRQASAFMTPGVIKQKHERVLRTCAHDTLQRRRSMMVMGSSDETSSRNRGFAEGVKRVLTTAAMGLALIGPMMSVPTSANAEGKREVGAISASGFVFKDKLNVEAFTDPKVQGVTLYLSDFSRPVADKLINGDIFSDPSSASMTCVRSGPMSVKDGINTSKEGEELLKEDRSFFKSIVVRRLYDKEANNVVYVSYSSKLDTGSDANKSRFKSSLCALHVE